MSNKIKSERNLVKKINHGKRFEEDFQSSASKIVWCYRLRDPAASFGDNTNGLRFSWRNICDFVMFKSPNLYLIECKSNQGSSVPFSKLKNKESDNRIRDMANDGDVDGIHTYVVFNWRDHRNKTMAVNAGYVHDFMLSYGGSGGYKKRVSIPIAWTENHGIEIRNSIKKVRYNYQIEDIMGGGAI